NHVYLNEYFLTHDYSRSPVRYSGVAGWNWFRTLRTSGGLAAVLNVSHTRLLEVASSILGGSGVSGEVALRGEPSHYKSSTHKVSRTSGGLAAVLNVSHTRLLEVASSILGGSGLKNPCVRWATASTERGIRFLARWPFGVSPVTIKSSTHKVSENIRWPSGSTECFSHTTTRGRQFDTRGWATASTERGIRFLARWPFGVSPVTIKSSTHKVLRTSGGLAAVLNVSHTRLLEVASSILGGSGLKNPCVRWATASTERGIRFLARWPFGVSPVTIKSSTHKRTSGGLAAVLNVSHTRLLEVASSILGGSGLKNPCVRWATASTERGIRFLARWPFGFENIRWPSGSTECFSHTTTRGRQFDTRGWATASTERGIRFLARWPFGFSENIRWPSGSTECFSHTTTRGRQFDTRGWATASTERGIRFLARWPFGVSPVTIKSSTHKVSRTSGGLAAVLNVSHTRLLEVASSILGGSGLKNPCVRWATASTERGIRFLARWPFGFENIRWPSGSTECFSHTTTRGRQFDTRGWATASTERGIRFLARWPFGVSPVTIKSSTHKVMRTSGGLAAVLNVSHTRLLEVASSILGGSGLKNPCVRWATASTERGIRFLARWPFGVSPVTIKSSTHKVLRTSGGLAAVLNVSHTRLLEVASSILGGSGLKNPCVRWATASTERGIRFLARWPFGFENIRWPSGSTECFSHTTTRGRQFDTRGWATASTERGIRFLARWPFGVSPVTIKSSTHKVSRTSGGLAAVLNVSHTRLLEVASSILGGSGLKNPCVRWATASTERGIRFLARWPFGVSPVTIKSSTHKRTSGGLAAVLNVSHTRLLEVASSILGGSGLKNPCVRWAAASTERGIRFLARWPFGVSPVTIKSSTHKVLRTSGGLAAVLNVSHTRLLEVASSILGGSGLKNPCVRWATASTERGIRFLARWPFGVSPVTIKSSTHKVLRTSGGLAAVLNVSHTRLLEVASSILGGSGVELG
ncbi:LOW QUALITY PROTEIN: hypothetical protein HID58_039937, partial [Brassica napus]